MTKSTWAVVIVVILMLAIGGAIAYRGPLLRLVAPAPKAPPVATTTPDTTAAWQSYATSTYSFKYPQSYAFNTAYAYDQFGPAKLIVGVSITIPAAMATGTNLSADTRLSIEQLPRAKKCTGDIFILANVAAQNITAEGTDYSLATTSGAAAGNLYEEHVYALATSTPCTAVRYLVHSANIANYEPGAVREFDRAALLGEFDKIRRSVRMK